MRVPLSCFALPILMALSGCVHRERPLIADSASSTQAPSLNAPSFTAPSSEATGSEEPNADEPSETPAAEAPRTVVLVAIDGVRWQEIFSGVDPQLARFYGLSAPECLDAEHLVPNLRRLMERDGAVIGAPGASVIAATGPSFLSLPGYMEMLSGRSDTGCTTNECGQVPFATVADDVTSAGLGEAAIIASWDKIARAATSRESGPIVSAGRHEGSGLARLDDDQELQRLLEAGKKASPEPGHGDFRPDKHTARIAVHYLRVTRPGFLFVGLGETDEYGHRNDYRGYLRALHEADQTIGVIADTVLQLAGKGARSTLLVTTDHGRSKQFFSHGGDFPESARVFLVAAGAGIVARGVVPAHPHRLADIGQTIRALMGLPLAGGAQSGEVVSELFVPPSTGSL